MEDKNYLTILGWMFRLKLKPIDLMIFAIVYSFSRDGNSRYFGSYSFICKTMNVSKNSAIRSLKLLTDEKLIIKKVVKKNNVSFNEYYVNTECVETFLKE